jgi:hypothetical protein
MQSTSAVPEHILAYGLYGSGKTHAWATVADSYRQEGSTNKFYVIGTEHGALGRLSDGYPDFDKNVEWKDVGDWYQLADLTTDYVQRAEKGDWIVLEGGDKPWHWVQMLWDKLHGEPATLDPVDPFAMERGMPDGSINRDWVKINGVYRNWINSILRSPAHVFSCNPQDALKLPTGGAKGWSDDKEVIDQYSRFGFKPAGQKELGHHFHTVLWMKNPAYKQWTITSVDDHTRELLDNQVVSNFVLDYLVKIARWEL